MRVLVISRAALVGSYQPKLEAIASHPDVELTVVVPPRWKERGRVQELEAEHTRGYQLVVENLAINGSFHTHFYPRLARRIAAVRPDVVHIEEEPYNVASWHAARLAARHGARVVCFTWQNIERRYPPPFSTIERQVLRRVDHLVCGSHASVDVWRAKGYRGAVSVLPQVGVDPATWTPAPAQTLGARPFTVGYVGRLVPEKGVELLVHAFAQLRGDARLVLIGDGPTRERLERVARDSGVADRVVIENWMPSSAMPERMRDLDVLALPSLTRPNWREQFGRVLVEAMASGVPVVGSSSGEIPAVIDDAGLVVPEGDVGALGEALQRLADDADFRASLARRGRERVLGQFTQTRIAERTVEIYREVLSTARRRVTIVAHEIHDGGGMELAMAELVRRAAPDWDLTVVACRLAPELRSLVTWRRVRVPARPLAVRLLAFGAVAAPKVATTGDGLVHTLGAIVPTRADLASVHYCHGGARAGARTSGADVARSRRINSAIAHWCALAAERWCYRPGRLRRFAAVSPDVAREVSAAYPGVPISITPNGVDVERFAPDAQVRTDVRCEEGAGDDVVVLFVGGDWARKGLAVTIAAGGRLVRDGAPVRLWVVGRGDEARYRQLAHDAGVDDRVHFFGFRTDRERFFRAADVFVLPSQYEAFCLAALEAAAAGLPLVMTPVNGADALVREGTGGVLVAADAGAVAEALAALVADPARREADGRAAHARAAAYTWSASAASVVALYRELSGSVR